jgi:hypothetical protein
MNKNETKKETKKIAKKDLDDEIIYDSNFDSTTLPEKEDEITNDYVSQKVKGKIDTDFLDKVVKYVEIDNIIRKETLDYRETINTLKEDKDTLEAYILRYLDKVENDVINIGDNGKLSRQESIRKSAINQNIIRESIFEQLKKEKLVKDDKKGKEFADATFELMDSKREIKKRVYLKRTLPKNTNKKKNKKEEN